MFFLIKNSGLCCLLILFHVSAAVSAQAVYPAITDTIKRYPLDEVFGKNTLTRARGAFRGAQSEKQAAALYRLYKNNVTSALDDSRCPHDKKEYALYCLRHSLLNVIIYGVHTMNILDVVLAEQKDLEARNQSYNARLFFYDAIQRNPKRYASAYNKTQCIAGCAVAADNAHALKLLLNYAGISVFVDKNNLIQGINDTQLVSVAGTSLLCNKRPNKKDIFSLDFFDVQCFEKRKTLSLIDLLFSVPINIIASNHSVFALNFEEITPFLYKHMAEHYSRYNSDESIWSAIARDSAFGYHVFPFISDVVSNQEKRSELGRTLACVDKTCRFIPHDDEAKNKLDNFINDIIKALEKEKNNVIRTILGFDAERVFNKKIQVLLFIKMYMNEQYARTKNEFSRTAFTDVRFVFDELFSSLPITKSVANFSLARFDKKSAAIARRPDAEYPSQKRYKHSAE